MLASHRSQYWVTKLEQIQAIRGLVALYISWFSSNLEVFFVFSERYG